MDQDAIIQYVADTFAGVEVLRPADGPGAGDTFFFAAAQRNVDPARRMPFATIVSKDYGDFDNSSNLDRADVFRLNIGVRRDTFHAIADQVANPDFAALDCLLPHPVYAPQSWLCVLNPGPETFEAVKPLLAEAHAIVTARHVNTH